MLPEVRKILYSTDLSKSSTAAFEHATYIAKKTGAEIHILHVVEKLSNEAKITLQTYVMDRKSRHELLQERVRNAESKLHQRQDNFWDNLHPDEINVRQQIKSVNVVEAFPAETILKYAKDLDVDLIVMGSHEKGIMHTFLGSVAKNVLNRAHVPMMIIPIAVKEG
jgi:nucleotide-binding universal stress UspA family protein